MSVDFSAGGWGHKRQDKESMKKDTKGKKKKITFVSSTAELINIFFTLIYLICTNFQKNTSIYIGLEINKYILEKKVKTPTTYLSLNIQQLYNRKKTRLKITKIKKVGSFS